MAVAFEVEVSSVGALGSLMLFRASPEMMLFYYFICVGQWHGSRDKSKV